MKKRIGVVADDVTGANDIGIMFAKNQYETAVFPLKLLKEEVFLRETKNLDTIIIDTDSRFDTKEAAAKKVKQATKLLMKLNCDMYHKKTCSVFRGNIGAEFDAMQDALGVSCSMVIAAFPHNGRTTVDGVHYVYGTKLEDSQFREDPIHQMKTSSLMEILKEQTSREIANITYEDLDLGIDFINEKIEQLKKKVSYIIFDVRNQKDLRLIAKAVKEEKNICGSSAIGEELPDVYSGKTKKEKPVLIVAGSLTKQSIGQIAYMKKQEYPILEFKTSNIFEKELLQEEIKNLVEQGLTYMKSEGHVVIHTSNKKEQVLSTKEKGKELGLTYEEIGKRISKSIYSITEQVLKQIEDCKLIVAGGDTSAAVTEGLNIYKMKILKEIETGVPVMKAATKFGEIDLVLKSGSFGSESFLLKAAEILKLQ